MAHEYIWGGESMTRIDKNDLISQLKQEIAFAKTTGMPQFVAGLQRAKQIAEKQQPVKIKDLDVKHMKIENEVVDRISQYLDTPAAEWAVRDLIKPLVDELARMRRNLQ